MLLFKEKYFLTLILKKQRSEIKNKKNKQFLKNQKLVLEETITTIKEDNIKLKNEIKFLKEDIKNLQAQKNERNWQLIFLNIVTFGIFKYFRTKKINQQIIKLKKENSKLQIKINKNKKSKQFFTNQKLIFFENDNIFLKNLFSDATITDSAFADDEDSDIEVIPYEEDSNNIVTASVIMNNQDNNDTRVIAAGFTDEDSDIEVIPYEEDSDATITDSAFADDEDSDIEVIPYEEDSNNIVTASVIMNNQDNNDTRVIAAGFTDEDSDIEVIPYEEDSDATITDSAFADDEDSDIEKLSINSSISFSASVINENNNLCRISIL